VIEVVKNWVCRKRGKRERKENRKGGREKEKGKGQEKI